MKENTLAILKLLAQKRRELSICKAEKYDSEYIKTMDRVVEQGKKYEKLDLKLDDKMIIDELIKAMDNANEEEVNLSYLLGMKDCVMIIDKLGLFQL